LKEENFMKISAIKPFPLAGGMGGWNEEGRMKKEE